MKSIENFTKEKYKERSNALSFQKISDKKLLKKYNN